MLRLSVPAIVLIVFSCQSYAGAVTDTENTAPAATILKKDGLVNGELTLDVAGQQVLAAYLPQTLGEQRGAIILLHDKSTQFNSPLLHHLREDLPAFGWDTLTISLNHQKPQNADNTEMPDAVTNETVNPEPQAEITDDLTNNNDAAETPQQTDKADDPKNNAATPAVEVPPSNPERMDAAIAWLREKNPQYLIFLGHGAGVQTAINAIAATPQPISALVMVSANNEITAEKIIDANLPVLDIRGSEIDEVTEKAAVKRYSQLKFNTTQPYSQRQIHGAGRDFKGVETLLSKQVHSWLHRQLIADLRP